MNNKICANCNHINESEMSFCGNCGAELSQTAGDPPPTMMAGNFGAFSQSGQSFQTPNYQQQNYRSQNYQQPNFQPNFQTPNVQNASSTNGGQTKKILLGVGGLLIGLVMLASGGVKLYRAFGDSSGSNSMPTVSPTTQNFYTNSSTSNTSGSNTSNTTGITPSATPPLRTIADFTQQRVGDWTLRDTMTGSPEKDGFSGAREEKQFKYFNSSQAMVHLTVADYPSEIAAKNALRASMAKFKNLNLKVGEETVQSETVITQTMASANGKIFTRYWTNNNYLYRALGTETDVESFFGKSIY